ncbi:MAG: hypothetical protein Q8N65_01820 [bacterium]|nr:hypothetical protein [bacterium]
MALKEGWPAIRAEWLWDWQKRGTLKTVSLFGTKVLIVAENARPRKTCYRIKGEKTYRVLTRYWLGKGVLLVPRWDPLEFHYDPVADGEVEILDSTERKERGIYRQDSGDLLVLIYQHLEDALHFQRQQWHMSLESYPEELQQIFNSLAKIEEKALEFSGDGLRGLDYRQRREEINRILTCLAGREKAAAILLRLFDEEITLAQKCLLATLSSQTVKDLLKGSSVNDEGLRAYLVKIYQNLSQIGVKPIVKPLDLAQRQIRAALGSLDVGETSRMVHHIKLTIKSLEEAGKSLQRP